jgi:hexosaminidase
MRAFLLASILASARANLLWPAPQSVSFGASAFSIDSRFFSFAVTGYGNASAVLQDALTRYYAILFVRAPPTVSLDLPVAGALGALAIDVGSSDETLNAATSENFTLTIAAGAATLTADTVFGALRGLETFSQLVDFAGAGSASPDSPFSFVAPAVTIADFPRFAHRGALIDTARHFLPVVVLQTLIDAMAYTKLNVLHWHIVDDQAFPYVSRAFPGLSEQGAWGAPGPAAAAHVYSTADVQGVLSYARSRGVRVVVEFDTPGHSQSWGASVPGLLTQCYSNASGTPVPVPGNFGPIDPTSDAAWTFLNAFFAEVAQVFPDTYASSAQIKPTPTPPSL